MINKIVVGLGNGFGYATPIPVMAKWFPDRRGLAVGLAVAGYGGGSALFGPLCSGYLIPVTEMLVVVDDFALPFGKLRFREGGGPGGHNGLRSIIGELESEAFSRLRIGIGAPDGGFVDHVLTRFEPDERQRLDELLDAAADAVEAWAREGTSKAATRFNAFELRPADEDRLAPPGDVDGPPGPDGVRRTKTGWRRVLSRRRGPDEGGE